MSDRERLAADIAAWGEVSGREALADRLIALGWTRLDGSLTILRAYKKGFQRSRNTLDEERLARALPAWTVEGNPHPDALRRTVAGLIAKAYREDTDDRP